MVIFLLRSNKKNKEQEQGDKQRRTETQHLQPKSNNI